MKTHPSLNRSVGPGMWKRLVMGNLMTQYGCFYTRATREFSNIHGPKEWNHQLETKKKVKALQAMNVKHNLSPNTGVEQLKKEHAEENKVREDNIMAQHYLAKSSRWTTYTNRE